VLDPKHRRVQIRAGRRRRQGVLPRAGRHGIQAISASTRSASRASRCTAPPITRPENPRPQTFAPHITRLRSRQPTIERNSAMTTHVNRFVGGARRRKAARPYCNHGSDQRPVPRGFLLGAPRCGQPKRPRWTTALAATDRRRRVSGASREPFPHRHDLQALENPAGTTPTPAETNRRVSLADLNDEVHQKATGRAKPIFAPASEHAPNGHSRLSHLRPRARSFWSTDTDEVLMRPGDTVIIRGTNHAWSNRSNTPMPARRHHDRRHPSERRLIKNNARIRGRHM